MPRGGKKKNKGGGQKGNKGGAPLRNKNAAKDKVCVEVAVLAASRVEVVTSGAVVDGQAAASVHNPPTHDHAECSPAADQHREVLSVLLS